MQSATEIEIERQQNADSLAAKIPAYFTLLFSLSFSHFVSLSLLHLSQPVKGSLTRKQRKVCRWPLSAKVVQRFSIKFNLLISIICASSDRIADQQHTMKIYILYSIVYSIVNVWDKRRKTVNSAHWSTEAEASAKCDVQMLPSCCPALGPSCGC